MSNSGFKIPVVISIIIALSSIPEFTSIIVALNPVVLLGWFIGSLKVNTFVRIEPVIVISVLLFIIKLSGQGSAHKHSSATIFPPISESDQSSFKLIPITLLAPNPVVACVIKSVYF